MEERQVSPLESEHWETRMKTLLRENSESHELEERLQALLAANNEKLIQRITRTLAPEWISDGKTVSEATEEVSTLQPPSKGPSLRSGTVDRTSGTSAVNRTSGASAVNRTSGASAVSHPSVSHNASAETVNVDELEGINEEEEEEDPEQRERKMRQSITSLNSADERAYKSALVKQQDRQHRRDQVLASSGSSGLSKAKETCLEANRRVVASWSFETFFAVCIFSNAVFIGVEVQYASLNRTSRLPDIFFVLDQTYAGIFLLELLLRFLAEGLPFFWSSPNLVWNYLDMLINFTSLLNLAAVIGQGIGTEDVVSAGNMRVVRILRLTRVIRVVRIVKIVRFIRALRSLVLSILGTLKVLLWSVLLLFMILYVFGIVFTDVSNEYSGQNQLEEISTESIDFLQQHFYDLERTMQTLFQSICNGNSWGVVADNLNKISRLWGYLYLTYVAFCLFAVLNVMTGMFCQSAIESAERDQELHIQSVLSTKQQQIETFVKIFELLQKDRRRHHSDKVTFADFQHLFDDPRIRVFFQALDVETKDAWTLFKLMDTSGNGDLDVEEFVEGCMKLKGPARSVDVSLILQEHRRLRKKILSMEQVLLEVRTRMRKPEQGEKVFSM